MSQEISVVATITAAPDKVERLREVLKQSTESIHKHEPDCLEFKVIEETDGEGNTHFALVERYKSQQALDHHHDTDNFKNTMGAMSGESLLAGAPSIIRGKLALGFQSR